MKKDSKNTAFTNLDKAGAGPSPSSQTEQRPPQARDLLSREDAAAGSPADYSVSGEEDPGAGLEALVRRDK